MVGVYNELWSDCRNRNSRLRLNPAKMEVMWLGSHQQLKYVDITDVAILQFKSKLAFFPRLPPTWPKLLNSVTYVTRNPIRVAQKGIWSILRKVAMYKYSIHRHEKRVSVLMVVSGCKVAKSCVRGDRSNRQTSAAIVRV